MLTSLGFVILGGAALAAVCRKIQLPTIIGLMLAGMLLGPQGAIGSIRPCLPFHLICGS